MTDLEIAQGEYINLLESECNNMIVFASLHGYMATDEDVLYGLLLRKEIKQLKNG